MGLLGFLQFLLKYWFYDLAWPLFALVYPLYASIKAIEANSVLDTQKLNTYWVVFSLILLLEHALKLLEWFPFWPYIRLITVCSLVIPYFDGAFYVYKQVICPLLSVDPQVVINWFPKPKQTSVERETILAKVEKYIKENGTEALEKIIACKSGSKNNPEVKEIKAVPPVDGKVVDQPNSNEPNVARKDIKAVDVTEKNEVKAAIQVSQVEPELAQGTENRTFLPPETKETVPEVAVRKEHLPQTPALAPKIIQKETAQSETTFSPHLQGEKHKVMEEAAKAKSQTFPPKITRSYVPKKPNQPTNEEPRTSTKDEAVSPKVVFSYMHKQSNQPTYEPANQAAVPNRLKPTVVSHDRLQDKPNMDVPASSTGKKSDHKHKEGPKKSFFNSEMKQKTRINISKASVALTKDLSCWCLICNLNCTNKFNLECHLRGRKHLSQVQFLRSPTGWE